MITKNRCSLIPRRRITPPCPSARRPVKEDMTQTMEKAGNGIGKGLSPVLARRSRHFPRTKGVSRALPKSSSTLLDYKLLMPELRVSAAEAAWALPPSSVYFLHKSPSLLENVLQSNGTATLSSSAPGYFSCGCRKR